MTDSLFEKFAPENEIEKNQPADLKKVLNAGDSLDKKLELQKRREQEESKISGEYKKAVASQELEVTDADTIAVLSGAIKRKNGEENGVHEKKMKVLESENHVEDCNSSSIPDQRSGPDVEGGDSVTGLRKPRVQTAQVIAILPGIGDFMNEDSTDSDSSSSDSDIETDAFKKVVHVECSESSCDHAH